MKILTAIFCMGIFIIGCNRIPKADVAAEANAIRTLEGQALNNIQNKDVDNLMTLFATDAIFMESGIPNSIGFENVRKRCIEMFADTTVLWNSFSVTIENIEVSASGDLGYVKGTNKISAKTPTGTIESTGKWLDIWKKSDGKWKCIVDVMIP